MISYTVYQEIMGKMEKAKQLLMSVYGLSAKDMKKLDTILVKLEALQNSIDA